MLRTAIIWEASGLYWDNTVAKKFMGKLVTLADITYCFPMSYSWAHRHFAEDITTGKWSEDWSSLDQFEINKIEEMLQTKEFSFYEEDDSRTIIVRKYDYDFFEQTANYVIFARHEDQVTCIMVPDKFPGEIYERLTKAWPWNLTLKDLYLLDDISAINLFGKNYIYPDEKTHWRMRVIMERQARERFTFSVEKCAWALGYDGYLRTHSMNALERYKDELKKLTDSENNIYFASVKDPVYSSMSQWANRRGGSINQLIKSLGFTRIYKRENPFQDVLIPFNRPNMEDDVQERLKRLKKMQGMLDKISGGTYRRIRCQELVDELKKLYNNRCQLCGEENGTIPFIEKDNGDYYCEMHHIVPISEVKNLADEWEFLDTYLNALICCPHHHRFLHYHHGGFKKLMFEDGQAFLESRKGTRIRIIINLHLHGQLK